MGIFDPLHLVAFNRVGNTFTGTIFLFYVIIEKTLCDAISIPVLQMRKLGCMCQPLFLCTCINSFNLHNIPIKQVQLLSPFYRCRIDLPAPKQNNNNITLFFFSLTYISNWHLLAAQAKNPEVTSDNLVTTHMQIN